MPDLGRTATWKTRESAIRPALGKPEGRLRIFPGSSLAKIRPGGLISGPESGPESLLCTLEHIYIYIYICGPVVVGAWPRACPLGRRGRAFTVTILPLLAHQAASPRCCTPGQAGAGVPGSPGAVLQAGPCSRQGRGSGSGKCAYVTSGACATRSPHKHSPNSQV